MSWKYRRAFKKAQAALDALDYETAELELTRILEESPQEVEARLHRAYVRLRKGNLEAALQDSEVCIRERSEQGVMWMVHGQVLLAQQDWPGAKEALLRSVKLEPDNGQSLYFLAEVFARLGNQNEAAHCLENALHFSRDFVLAQVYARQLSHS